MSLFDVLRYPISNHPTSEELSVLPEELFNKWVRLTDWQGSTRHKDPKNIGEWYDWVKRSPPLSVSLSPAEIKEVELLRKLIAEYEDEFV